MKPFFFQQRGFDNRPLPIVFQWFYISHVFYVHNPVSYTIKLYAVNLLSLMIAGEFRSLKDYVVFVPALSMVDEIPFVHLVCTKTGHALVIH